MNNTVDINRNNIKSININNLLQLDNIEEFLNSLVYKISKQDDMIQQLQNKCIQLEKEKYGNDNIYETDNMLYKMISKINNRLDNVEEKLLLQSQDITTILSQFEVIIHKELPLLVKLQDYNSELLTMKSHYNEELQKLYEYAVPVQISNHYENIQNDILDRLSHVETNVLPRKIDRSEFQQVEILVNKLKVYDNFKYNTNMALEKIDEDIKVFHENFSTTSYHIATLQDHLKKVNHTQEESIISTENQIKALKEKIIEHEISIKNSTTKEAGEEMSRVLEMAQVQLQELQRCRLSHETKIENVEKELQQCAKSCDVKQLYVLRKHYEEVVTALGLELDVKASLEQFQSVDTKIANIEKVIEAEKKKIEVTLKFVDWFTERGEAYENNMKVLDKHIAKLAIVNHPTHRQPFSGQVRFTPISMELKQEVQDSTKNNLSETKDYNY